MATYFSVWVWSEMDDLHHELDDDCLMFAEAWRLGRGLFTGWSRYQVSLIKRVQIWISGFCIFDSRCPTHGMCINLVNINFRQLVLFNIFRIRSRWGTGSATLCYPCSNYRELLSTCVMLIACPTWIPPIWMHLSIYRHFFLCSLVSIPRIFNRLWLYWAVGCGDQLRTISKGVYSGLLFNKRSGDHKADPSGN